MITAVTVTAAEITPGRQAELIYLLRQDCGSCHGMRLSGGLGPALLPERLRLWEVNQLAATILQGRPGTPMPPWRPFLTQQEAVWLATQLKQGIQP
jgi:cytochrome c55X